MNNTRNKPKDFLGIRKFFRHFKGSKGINPDTTYIQNKWLAKKMFQFKVIARLIRESGSKTSEYALEELGYIVEEYHFNKRWRKAWPHVRKAIHRGIVVNPHPGGYCDVIFTKSRLENTACEDDVFVGVPVLSVSLTTSGTIALIRMLHKATTAPDYNAWFDQFATTGQRTDILEIRKESYAFGAWYNNKWTPGSIELNQDNRRKDYYDYWEYYRKFWDKSYHNR